LDSWLDLADQLWTLTLKSHKCHGTRTNPRMTFLRSTIFRPHFFVYKSSSVHLFVPLTLAYICVEEEMRAIFIYPVARQSNAIGTNKCPDEDLQTKNCVTKKCHKNCPGTLYWPSYIDLDKINASFAQYLSHFDTKLLLPNADVKKTFMWRHRNSGFPKK